MLKRPDVNAIYESVGLIKEDQPPCSPSSEDKDAPDCPVCAKNGGRSGLIRSRGIGYTHSCNSWGNHRVTVANGKAREWDGTKDHYTRMKAVKEGELPPAMISGEPEKDTKPTASDQKKVQAVLDDKNLPEKAEDGKAYVVFWADGRGVFAVKTKKAIKDWLAETGSWAEIISIKYGPAEHKGKKLRVEDVIPVRPLLTEAQFQVNGDNLDKTYDAFKTTYEKRTGKAWTKDKFAQRVGGWTMYGDHDGFVSARQQASGPIKLVGSAGNLQGVKKGFEELLATGKPVWGMMDDKLANLSTRFGMVRPSPWVMKMVFKRILPKVAPALGVPVDKVTVNGDGSLTIDYPDVGKATKFLVGNKEYFDWMLKTHGDAIPAFARSAIAHFLVTGAHPSKPAGVEDEE